MDDSNPSQSYELLLQLTARREEFLAFVRRRSGQAIEPEDVMQRALLRAAEHAEQLRDPKRLGAWFYAILRRVLADARQQQRRLGTGSIDSVELAAPEAPSACTCSLQLLELLPAAYADILRRVDVGGQDLSVVAEQLGTSPNNAAVRLHRARQALRDKLQERCGTTSSGACQNCRC